jgi:hypothetical protein
MPLLISVSTQNCRSIFGRRKIATTGASFNALSKVSDFEAAATMILNNRRLVHHSKCEGEFRRLILRSLERSQATIRAFVIYFFRIWILP